MHNVTMAWIPAWTHRPPRPTPQPPSTYRAGAGDNSSGIRSERVMPPPGRVIAQPYMMGVVPPPMHLPPPPTLAMLTAAQRPPPLAALTATRSPLLPTIATPTLIQRPPPPTIAAPMAAQRPPPAMAAPTVMQRLPPPPTLAMLTAIRSPPPPAIAAPTVAQRPPPPPTVAMPTGVQRPMAAPTVAQKLPPPPTLAMLTAAQRPRSIPVGFSHTGIVSGFGPPAPSHAFQMSSPVPVVRPPNIADSLITAQPKIKNPPVLLLPQLPFTSPLHAPHMPALVPMSRPPNSENTTATAQPKTRYLPPASSLSHPPSLHPPPASVSLTPSRLYEIKTKIKVVHAEMQQELDKARRIVTERERLREGWDEGGTDMETETASVMQRTKETETPKTASYKTNVEDDPEYISAIHNATRLKEELENLNANLTPERLAVVAKKITKALKRKEWKKRRIAKMQEYRDTTEERRRILNAEIDQKCEKILERDKKKEKRKLAKQVAKQERREERRQEARKIAQGKQTVALVQKLQQLKALRRERMKRAGHFFPEEDNEFFERIHKAEEALKQPIEKSANWDTNFSKKQMEKEKKIEAGLEKQEIVNTKCTSAKVGMSPPQDNESNAAENASVLDEITMGTDTGMSKRKPCQVDAFEDSLQTDMPIDQTILPPTKMQKLGQGSSQQQQLLQAQQESQLLSEKDQEQGSIVSLEPPTHFTPEQPNVEGSTSTALVLGRVRRKRLRKPISYRDVWSSYQISQKDGLRKERIATPIPEGLGAPPDKPSSLEWAKYLV